MDIALTSHMPAAEVYDQEALNDTDEAATMVLALGQRATQQGAISLATNTNSFPRHRKLYAELGGCDPPPDAAESSTN